MQMSVVDAYSELFHYTTAAGLKGIIESQQLRATNSDYLNDAEEISGFFMRRLPHLLDSPVRSVFSDYSSNPFIKSRIEQHSGVEPAIEAMKTEINELIQTTTLQFNTPYIAAFCGAKSTEESENGLLSQWRGYGVDGGYAVVFDTAKLEHLLNEEVRAYSYQVAFWGDVEYYDLDSAQKPVYDETKTFEENVQDVVYRSILGGAQENMQDLYEAITRLSCAHKHRGFREEKEVRIVAIPINDEVYEEHRKEGLEPERKPVLFEARNGILIPYIMLFGKRTENNLNKLPITKVIVGPHPDRLKRQKAVRLMLAQHHIEAEVIISDTPYIGQ